MDSKKNIIFVSLVMMSILPLATSDIYLPAMVNISQHLNVSVSWLQFSISIYIFFLGISQLVFGIISDRIQFYKIFLFFMMLYLVGTLLCLLSNTFMLFLFGRILQAIGAAAALVSWQTCAVKLYEENRVRSIISILFVLVCLSPGIAPIFGASLTKNFGWKWCFVALFFYGATLSFLVYKNASIFKFEYQSGLSLKNISWQLLYLRGNNRFIKYLFVISSCYSGYLAFLLAYPVLAVQYGHASIIDVGALFIPIAISFSIGSFIGMFFLTKRPANQTVTLGLILYTFSILLFMLPSSFNNSLTIISLSFNLLMFSNGILLPAATSEAILCVKKFAATASGLIGSFRMTMAFLVTTMLSILSIYNIRHVLFLLLLTNIVIAWVFNAKKNGF